MSEWIAYDDSILPASSVTLRHDPEGVHDPCQSAPLRKLKACLLCYRPTVSCSPFGRLNGGCGFSRLRADVAQLRLKQPGDWQFMNGVSNAFSMAFWEAEVAHWLQKVWAPPFLRFDNTERRCQVIQNSWSELLLISAAEYKLNWNQVYSKLPPGTTFCWNK